MWGLGNPFPVLGLTWMAELLGVPGPGSRDRSEHQTGSISEDWVSSRTSGHRVTFGKILKPYRLDWDSS